jgi:phage gp29-like protein
MPPTYSIDITKPSPQDRYQRRLGAGITPQTITAVLRDADLGNMWGYADLLDEIRQGDPHLHGDLTKRELTVSGADYEIRLPTTATKREGNRALRLCQDALASIEVEAGTLGLSARGAMQNLLTATFHGRAAVELTYVRDGRYTMPRHAYAVHPRRLSWSNESDWRLYLYDATSGDTRFAKFPGVPLSDAAVFPRGRMLVHMPRQFGTYPTREGLGRALVWFSAFKRWTVRDWLAFAEWAGRGLRVGKYATGRDPQNDGRANDEDVTALQEALQAMSSTVATVIPDVTDIKVIEAKDNQVHNDLVKLCNGEMSKMVLGGTLVSDPGDRGARSLGEVHLRAMSLLLKSDAENLADTIRRDLFVPLVRANLGDRAPVPFIAFGVEPPADAKERAERLKLYMDQGLRVPAEWIYDAEGIPSPQPGDVTIGGTGAAVMPRADAPPAEPPPVEE